MKEESIDRIWQACAQYMNGREGTLQDLFVGGDIGFIYVKRERLAAYGVEINNWVRDGLYVRTRRDQKVSPLGALLISTIPLVNFDRYFGRQDYKPLEMIAYCFSEPPWELEQFEFGFAKGFEGGSALTDPSHAGSEGFKLGRVFYSGTVEWVKEYQARAETRPESRCWNLENLSFLPTYRAPEL